jgi:hypothetical protein
MQIREVSRSELVAVGGGALLALSIFMGWYSLGNRYAYLNACRGAHSTCSGLTSLGPVAYMLLVMAVVPLVLASVVVRGQVLPWPRGELTAVISLVALTLILFRGVIDRPGFPSGEIGIGIGWFVALLGGLLILVGALARTYESTARRKPPGMF